mmetsp:Transcript_103819/g.334751  ORF Transcript_103819/g.334751 Transcript_103819/m.334751 type:complete len:213 (-) Transcript_103819:346-984(-)
MWAPKKAPHASDSQARDASESLKGKGRGFKLPAGNPLAMRRVAATRQAARRGFAHVVSQMSFAKLSGQKKALSAKLLWITTSQIEIVPSTSFSGYWPPLDLKERKAISALMTPWQCCVQMCRVAPWPGSTSSVLKPRSLATSTARSRSALPSPWPLASGKVPPMAAYRALPESSDARRSPFTGEVIARSYSFSIISFMHCSPSCCWKTSSGG